MSKLKTEESHTGDGSQRLSNLYGCKPSLVPTKVINPGMFEFLLAIVLFQHHIQMIYSYR